MSNEHLPVDPPLAVRALTQQVLAALGEIGQHPTTQSWLGRLSAAMVYVAGAMLAFIVAIDGYVLLRTM